MCNAKDAFIMVGIYTEPLQIYAFCTSTRQFRLTTLHRVRLHHPHEKETMRCPQLVYLHKCASFCFWLMSTALCSSVAPASDHQRIGRKGKGTSAGKRWKIFQNIDKQISVHPKYPKSRFRLSPSAGAASVLLVIVVVVVVVVSE